MTAARRLLANRANARRSGGPITAAGRARAAQNARRHGLSRSVCSDLAYAGDIAALTRAIAGANAGAEELALAGCIAAAQVDLMRVRRARRDGMSDAMCAGMGDSMGGGGCDARAVVRLAAIDDYERRALSRRKFAIRAFDAAVARSRRTAFGETNPRCSLATAAGTAARPCTQAAKARHRAREATLRRPGARPTLRAETMRSRHEVRPRREDNMTKSSAPTRRISRRRFMAGTAGAGAALASNLAAPGLLAQTRAPIKLGNLNSFTGAIAYAAENNLNGMNLFFDSVGWTVGGRKIEIIKEDDQFNPQVGLQKAKKLVESDKVDMIVGVQASNVALAVLNYAKQQKAFYIVSGAGTDAITWDRYPYLFRTSISAYQLSTPMANWVYDNLGKEIVTTASDYAGGRDVIAQFKGPYVARGGKVLKEIWPPLGTTDFSPYLIDIKSINPPVTYDFMPGADAIRFIQQYTEFGLKEKMPLTGFTIIDSLTISALGKAALGVISATTYTDTVDNPQSKQFVTDYQAKYKALPDIFSDYGYVAARAVYEALKATDGDASNKDKLSEAMTKVKFDAPRGPFRMDPVTHNPIEDIHICQVIEKDGKVTSKVITTFKDVQDPGKKIY
jgi:branched-chain amino acid transport system substrate-binding protein